MVRTGVVSAIGARLTEKLHAVSKLVVKRGNLDMTETKCDLWVGIVVHVKTKQNRNLLREENSYGRKASNTGEVVYLSGRKL